MTKSGRTRGTSSRDALGFSDEVKAKLGLRPKKKLSPWGHMARVVETQWGTTVVWADPYTPGRKRGDRRHRAKTACPKCAKVLSAGRLHQHMVVHSNTTPSVDAGTP